MVPALEDGHIDAAAVTEPTLALTNGKYRVISLAAHNVAPTFMVSGFAANPAWIKAHPDLAAKFAAALMKANAWANTHHTESAAILAKVSKLSPDVAGRMVRVYYGEHLDRAQLQPVIDATAKYGVIPKTFPAAEIMSTDGK
jgi:NitT/TauT family transport system substrate-binding protein